TAEDSGQSSKAGKTLPTTNGKPPSKTSPSTLSTKYKTQSSHHDHAGHYANHAQPAAKDGSTTKTTNAPKRSQHGSGTAPESTSRPSNNGKSTVLYAAHNGTAKKSLKHTGEQSDDVLNYLTKSDNCLNFQAITIMWSLIFMPGQHRTRSFHTGRANLR